MSKMKITLHRLPIFRFFIVLDKKNNFFKATYGFGLWNRLVACKKFIIIHIPLPHLFTIKFISFSLKCYWLIKLTCSLVIRKWQFLGKCITNALSHESVLIKFVSQLFWFLLGKFIILRDIVVPTWFEPISMIIISSSNIQNLWSNIYWSVVVTEYPITPSKCCHTYCLLFPFPS